MQHQAFIGKGLSSVWRMAIAVLSLWLGLTLLLQSPDALAQGAAASAPLKTLNLSARIGTGVTLRSGLAWRVYPDRADANGNRAVLMQSSEATPQFSLPDGDYIVHAAFGLAGVTRKISLQRDGQAEVVALTAGALRITGILGDQKIPPTRETIAVYVPQPGNSEAKLVVQNAHPGDVIGLPEGTYHLVSTYLDMVGVGSLNATSAGIATNSVINADISVPSGRYVDVTLRHRAATLTLKLVKSPGAEALANTSFTVLTPGGDVIRELVGAFPSLVLAEGEYVLIARRDGKTFQSTFTVQSATDRDVEVIAQ